MTLQYLLSFVFVIDSYVTMGVVCARVYVCFVVPRFTEFYGRCVVLLLQGHQSCIVPPKPPIEV